MDLLVGWCDGDSGMIALMSPGSFSLSLSFGHGVLDLQWDHSSSADAASSSSAHCQISGHIIRTEPYALRVDSLQTFLAAFHILLSTSATFLALVVGTVSVVSSSGLRQQAIILSILLAIPLVPLVLVTKWANIFDGWIERSTRTRTVST
jgi:hypothetical protein